MKYLSEDQIIAINVVVQKQQERTPQLKDANIQPAQESAPAMLVAWNCVVSRFSQFGYVLFFKAYQKARF